MKGEWWARSFEIFECPFFARKQLAKVYWPGKFVAFFRIVSLSCSPTGGAFVCSAAASKKSGTSPLRLSQSFSKSTELFTLTSNNLSSSSGVLQCWDMKAMKVEVWLAGGVRQHTNFGLLAFAFIIKDTKTYPWVLQYRDLQKGAIISLIEVDIILYFFHSILCLKGVTETFAISRIWSTGICSLVRGYNFFQFREWPCSVADLSLW